MRAAATLVLARDGDAGRLEILLVKRGEAGDFPGLHVFPGGLVDPADADARLVAASRRDPQSADRLLAADSALPSFIAAVRESLEEVGVLLADGAHDSAQVRDWQQRLLAREFSFADLVARESLQLATDQLGYFSHWITPIGIPRRYDTRFLVARMPAGQPVQVDGREAISHDWLRPADALAANARGELRLIFPTIRNLEALAAFASVGELLTESQRVRALPAMLPKMIGLAPGSKDASGLQLLLPGDPGYDQA